MKRESNKSHKRRETFPLLIRNQVLIILGCFLFSFFIRFSGYSQYNLNFESARAIPKRSLSLLGFYSPIYEKSHGIDRFTYNTFGLSFGYAATKTVQIKLLFMRCKSIDTDDWNYYYYQKRETKHCLSLGYKISTRNNRFAFYTPLIIEFGKYVEYPVSFNPALIYTLPLWKILELDVSGNTHFSYSDDDESASIALGINLGFSLSNNLNTWSLRPRFGFLTWVYSENPKTTYNFGIAIFYNLKGDNN